MSHHEGRYGSIVSQHLSPSICLPAFFPCIFRDAVYVVEYSNIFLTNISCVFRTICYCLLQGDLSKSLKFGFYKDLQPEFQKIDVARQLASLTLEFMYVHIMLFIMLELPCAISAVIFDCLYAAVFRIKKKRCVSGR